MTAPRPPSHNLTGLDYRRHRLPPPPVTGRVIDFHCHLFAASHADAWFDAADAYGIGDFCTMTPLEEAVGLQRRWGHRLHFIAVAKWIDPRPDWDDQWRRTIESFWNLGSRILKFHMAPQSIKRRGAGLDDPRIRRLLTEATDRGMIVMTHVGDPDTWYEGKYAHAEDGYGTRDEHYAAWDRALTDRAGHPWVGAHLGGNPEDLGRLQKLLNKHPDLWLDLSATKWVVRELSRRRDAARDFVIRNADRLLWGSDQVSAEVIPPAPGLEPTFAGRPFDFLASRFWAHRMLFETAYDGPSPIADPDLEEGETPWLRGLALPDDVLQKVYRDNAVRLLATAGVAFDAG